MSIRKQIQSIDQELHAGYRKKKTFKGVQTYRLTPGRMQMLKLQKKALVSRRQRILWESVKPVFKWDEKIEKMVFTGSFEKVKGTYSFAKHGELKRRGAI